MPIENKFPIDELKKGMNEVKNGKFNVQIENEYENEVKDKNKDNPRVLNINVDKNEHKNKGKKAYKFNRIYK